MPDNGIARKLKLAAGQRAALINAPVGYVDELGQIPEGVELLDQLEGQFDWIQVFVRNRAELENLLPALRAALKPSALLWLSFPKGTSGIQTDLTRDRGWNAVEQSDLKWVTLVSVNDTWSAFSVRPYKPGEVRQAPRYG
jgi:hypothetical protein